MGKYLEGIRWKQTVIMIDLENFKGLIVIANFCYLVEITINDSAKSNSLNVTAGIVAKWVIEGHIKSQNDKANEIEMDKF